MIERMLKKAEIEQGKIRLMGTIVDNHWVEGRTLDDPAFLALKTFSIYDKHKRGNMGYSERVEEELEKNAPEDADVYISDERYTIENNRLTQNAHFAVIYLKSNLKD